ncbi:type VII secretion protein EccB [Streptomyces sp. RFCAC02]|uniref:type VII secretion protein EccB n=1 Tax=Streptomyces sp. RFCAC02 TaxID=2499143 RepID=UPI00101EFB80|nr:type VII secretion protein EccB [Streptomyces sp. RFCAC02]
MASRKDELNAYTYAKRRTVAAFLRPAPTGTEEGAPRPLRAVVPGAVVGALVLAAFGAWGLFRPAVPEGWDEPGAHVIIGSDSTTRYVVLDTDGQTQLHPVLNLSSARLLLDNTGDISVVNVSEEELDSGAIPRGPTLGIPYAPDRLPDAADAGEAKRWAACQQPGGDGGTVQQAVFVLADRDTGRVEGDERLTGGELLYVEDPDHVPYIVDAHGTRYRVGEEGDDHDLLVRLLTHGTAPQPVGREWLDTLAEGDPIVFPELPDTVGTDAGIGTLDERTGRVGMVLDTVSGGDDEQHYVVLPGRVVPVSPFMAYLLASHPDSAMLGMNSESTRVGAQDIDPAPPEESLDRLHTWPTHMPEQVNDGARDTLCSVLLSVDGDDGTTEVATWAGEDYPATIASGAATAYVTPGSGLLYRQIQGEQTESGSVFLVTDTGLRYSVEATADGEGETQDARTRLGYGDITPVPVPAVWSLLLPTGPRLDTKSAVRPQGS